MKILYFAWIRRSLKVSEETINPPKNIKNVKSLVNWLGLKSKKHKEVFLKIKSIRKKECIFFITRRNSLSPI